MQGCAPGAFAGLFGGRNRGEPARERANLARALATDCTDPDFHQDDRLALAAGAGLESIDGRLCLIEGQLYALDSLRLSVGLEPDASPARTISAAYGLLGPRILERLRGDFVVLIWDEAAGRGLIARDQLGGRSLFLRSAPDRLLFASELRNLLPLLSSEPGPDPVSMVHWLALGGPPGERTFYEGVHQLPAGHCVLLEPGGWRVARYWTPTYRRPERVDRYEAAQRVRGALVRSVRRRSANGGTGVLLSGGIDSAAVAGVAARRGVRAYSAVFPRHPSVDESDLVQELTSELGIAGFALPVLGGSVLAGAADYTREWRVPAASPNLFFWGALLRQAAADGVTAMLDGEGGDALFWLSPHLVADRLSRGRLLSALGLARRFPGADGRIPPRTLARLIRDWGLRGALPHSLHRLRRRLRGAEQFAPRWFSEDSVRLHFETDTELEWKRSDAPRWWSSLVEAVTGDSSTLIHDATRRRAASAGLDARHPLLDVDLIELVLGLPPELAFDPDVSRPLLREAVRGLVPEPVRMRRGKSSFDALFHEALATRDLADVRALLLAPDAEVNAFVDRDRVRAHLFEEDPPQTPGARQAWALDVWRLVTAETWLRSLAGRAISSGSAPDSDVSPTCVTGAPA